MTSRHTEGGFWDEDARRRAVATERRKGAIVNYKLREAVQAIVDLSVEIGMDGTLYDPKTVEQLGKAARILAGTCERVSNT